MRACPNCGFTESPIWKNVYRRLFTQYCHIDELASFEPELAKELLEKHYVFKNGAKYRLKKGYVHRIDAKLCANPDPNSPSISEPRKEKHKARIIGREKHQTQLFGECK